MNLDELLRTLSERCVSLWVDGQALRFRGEAGALDPALLAELAARLEIRPPVQPNLA